MLGLQILPPIGKENLRNYIKKKKKTVTIKMDLKAQLSKKP